MQTLTMNTLRSANAYEEIIGRGTTMLDAKKDAYNTLVRKGYGWNFLRDFWEGSGTKWYVAVGSHEFGYADSGTYEFKHQSVEVK